MKLRDERSLYMERVDVYTHRACERGSVEKERENRKNAGGMVWGMLMNAGAGCK